MHQLPLQITSTVEISMLRVPHLAFGTAFATITRARWGQLEERKSVVHLVASSFMVKTSYNVEFLKLTSFAPKPPKSQISKSKDKQATVALPDHLVACSQSTTEDEQVHKTNTHLVHLTHKHKHTTHCPCTLRASAPCRAAARRVCITKEHQLSGKSTSSLLHLCVNVCSRKFTKQIRHASNWTDTPAVACRSAGRPSGECNRPPKDRTQVPAFDVAPGERWQRPLATTGNRAT
jgi:hypothetical protein